MAKATNKKSEPKQNAKRKNSLNTEDAKEFQAVFPEASPGESNKSATQQEKSIEENKPREAFYVDPKAAKKEALQAEKIKEDIEPGEQIIFITGAKILKDKPVEITFIERKVDNDEGELLYKNAALPHKDFIAAFDTLKIHLAVIVGIIKSTDVINPGKITKALVEPFTITSFKIKGGEDKEGFTISGGFKDKYGRTGLNAPMVRNVNDPESGYIFIKELNKSIQKCQDEALLYRTGKHAPKAQTEMFESSEADK